MNKSELTKLKKKYYKNGFLNLKKFFNEKETIILTNEIKKIQKLKPKVGKEMMYYDKIGKSNKKILTRTENFIKYNKIISKLFKDKIEKFLEFLLSEKVLLFKDKVNWKLPKAKGFKPHQDAQVWSKLYKDINTFTSVLISIDPSNKENGCLEVVSKMHKTGLLGDHKSAIPNHICKKMSWKNIPTLPGDIIIFDSYTPHRSKNNNSKFSRRLVYLTYNLINEGDLRGEYYKNKRRSFPPDIERLKRKKYKYLI